MTRSRLLELPKELRLHILEHVFADDAPVIIGLPSGMPWHGKPARYHPPVVETCSVLRYEALPAYYKNRVVILVLRYREGRQQVYDWIERVCADDRICRHLTYVSLRYLEESHRSTSFHIDLRKCRILNRNDWLHPLTSKPLHLLGGMEHVLAHAKLTQHDDQATRTRPEYIRKLIDAMLSPLAGSKLLRCESMANLRLNGYTDFQLRFEIISIMYREP